MELLARDAWSLFGIALSTTQVDAFRLFEKELIAWNEKINLTAIRDPEGIRKKHFLDSLSCTLAWKESIPHSLVDIGTGAGFPGIPLKILHPSMQVTLVESVGKKAGFCLHMISKLGLNGIEIITARAEELGLQPEHREQYEWAVARAVASLPVLVEYLLPLVRIGGRVLAQKGESGPAELLAAGNAIRILGGQTRQLIKVTLPGVADERFLAVIEKTSPTPQNYPRKSGIPAKKPLK
jgi:16S rRNA (guanine527-N7)-methyltransferase